MKRVIFFCLMCFIGLSSVYAADSGGRHRAANNPQNPAPVPRVSIFSTSTDWQALTGLFYNEYHGEFKSSANLVDRGLVLYYLDGFPCYGLGEGVRIWFGQHDKHSGELRLACLYPPKEINFTWHHASRDADDEQSTGMLTCPVEAENRTLKIDLGNCKKGPEWDEYK